jgi:tetratricopeptide (TPR) repeat protein
MEKSSAQVSPEEQPPESLDELVGVLFAELSLSVELDRPSILLAVYESEFVRQKAEALLEGRLSELGQNVHRYQVDEEHFDVPLTLSQQSNLGEIVFFVTGLRWGGGKGGFNAYRALNLRREYFVDNSIRAVFWLTEKEAVDLPRRAPDFWAFRHRVIEFIGPAVQHSTAPSAQRLTSESRKPTQPDEELEASIALRQSMLADLPETEESAAARADLLYELSSLYAEKGEYTRTVDLLEQGLELVEQLGALAAQAGFLVQLGIACQHLDQEEKALSALRKATDLTPQAPSCWASLARVYGRFGHLGEALSAAEKVIELKPEGAETWSDLGSVYRQLGCLDEARYAYRKAVKLNPQDVHSWGSLGEVCRDLGRMKEALRAFNKAIKLDPQNVCLLIQQGHVNRHLERFRGAVDAYQTAIVLDPESVPARLSLAACYREAGQEEEAAAQVEILRPWLAEAGAYQRACFESLSGNIEEALRLLKIALGEGRISLAEARQDPNLGAVRHDQRLALLAGGDGKV